MFDAGEHGAQRGGAERDGAKNRRGRGEGRERESGQAEAEAEADSDESRSDADVAEGIGVELGVVPPLVVVAVAAVGVDLVVGPT
ncbi:hypothetical protein ACFXCZ_12570 [Streptomyces sp. NPDC059396]|uniref:hypothetical protein n=1 Tax=Streptomyces sp. NPDC059396 TaxID=3346819 RepID=UPI0036C35316